MNKFVRIRDIAIYHPDRVLDNEYYIKHFEKQKKDVRHLLEDVYGRKKRYVIDPDSEENSLTMQIEASKKVLQKCSLTGADMDMVIVATQIPEYVVPTCAIMLHRAIKGKKDAFCYDVNANCVSMLFAIESTYRYFESNPYINKVLIVGGEYSTQVHSPLNELGYGVFGDAACAVVLERTEDGQAGLLDSEFFVNDFFFDRMIFPHCGMSNIYRAAKEDILSTMEAVDCGLDDVIERIKKVLDRNNLKCSDISTYCFSQFVYRNVETIRAGLEIPEEKSLYVGDEYGYTGVSSPFLVFNKAIEEGKVQRGDYVLFWTIGAGVQHLIMLIRY